MGKPNAYQAHYDLRYCCASGRVSYHRGAGFAQPPPNFGEASPADSKSGKGHGIFTGSVVGGAFHVSITNPTRKTAECHRLDKSLGTTGKVAQGASGVR